jgi:hypothetical protein
MVTAFFAVQFVWVLVALVSAILFADPHGSMPDGGSRS